MHAILLIFKVVKHQYNLKYFIYHYYHYNEHYLSKFWQVRNLRLPFHSVCRPISSRINCSCLRRSDGRVDWRWLALIGWLGITETNPWLNPCWLTHWGRDKMDDISQRTFPNAFSWMKKSDSNFTEVCSQGSNCQYSIISSDNGFAPARQQAIIWTNDGLIWRCIYASSASVS